VAVTRWIGVRLASLIILVYTTRCLIPRYYIGVAGKVGQWVAGDKDYTGGVLRDARPDAIPARVARRGTQCAAQVTGCETRAYGAARVARGVGSPSDEPPSGCVRAQEKESERDVRRCRSTLHRRVHSRHGGEAERRGRSTLHIWAFSQQERGLQEEVTIYVPQISTLPLEGPEVERAGVVSEDTLPRCTEGHRLLTRRAGRGG
jgi:hypothetical protein